ncbi:FG-GAP repeat domain-containing protein [Longispora albida]|uniref:FG-GAP repeat domain-containing protein n=1 Tax=Longispora albida TaxID=203523 RepID=UPI000376FE01|nr:VCBS repeat-containing protein [Longispora albida]
MKVLSFAVVAALLGGATLAVPAVASAAPAGTQVLYVSPEQGCAPGGNGTKEKPFCGLQAAADVVEPGQTIRLAAGTHSGKVTLSRSGTADAPVVLEKEPAAAAGSVILSAAEGLSVTFARGAHDIHFRGITFDGQIPGPGIVFTGAAGVMVDQASFRHPLAIEDASRITIQRSTLQRGVRVGGGAADVVISTNRLLQSYFSDDARPVTVDGAARTAITGNTIDTGKAIGVANAADTVIVNNYVSSSSWDAQVVVDQVSAPSTKAHHNALYSHGSEWDVLYSWAGRAYKKLAEFQQATDQGAADYVGAWREMDEALVDSADPAVPGALTTDIHGNSRIKFPGKSGGHAAGHDRGATELVPTAKNPAHGQLSLVNGEPMTVELKSVKFGVNWGGSKLTGTYHWGDGETSTVSVMLPQKTVYDVKLSGGSYWSANEGWLPNALHRYAKPGQYLVKISYTIEGSGTVYSAVLNDGLPLAVPGSQVEASTGTSRLRADFNGDGYDDLVTWGPDWTYGMGDYTLNVQLGKEGRFEPASTYRSLGVDAALARGIKFLTAGDYDGDGRAELGVFVESGSGAVSFYTLKYDDIYRFGKKDDGKNGAVLRWQAPQWGTGTKFLSSGDFNGDGKTDIAMFYQYSGSHVGVFTLKGSADGSLGGFDQQWNAPNWGGGTTSVSSGDFDGDGNSELALFYSYGGSHVSVFTVDNGAVAQRWNAPYWGGGTKFVQAGNFTDAKKTDLALFYDYGDGHVTAFKLTGGLSSLGTIWDGPRWGRGTEFLAAGRYTTKTGRDDLALLYNYGGRTDPSPANWTLFTISPEANGGHGSPTSRWQAKPQPWINRMF